MKFVLFVEGYTEKLAVLLKGDPERLGAAYVEKSGRVFEITKNEPENAGKPVAKILNIILKKFYIS